MMYLLSLLVAIFAFAISVSVNDTDIPRLRGIDSKMHDVIHDVMHDVMHISVNNTNGLQGSVNMSKHVPLTNLRGSMKNISSENIKWKDIHVKMQAIIDDWKEVYDEPRKTNQEIKLTFDDYKKFAECFKFYNTHVYHRQHDTPLEEYLNFYYYSGDKITKDEFLENICKVIFEKFSI